METFDQTKKQEMETAKTKLEKTKAKTAEVLTRIAKTESEHQDMRASWERKLYDLKNTKAKQKIRLKDLREEFENLRAILQPRRDEEVALTKRNAMLWEEYDTVVTDTTTSNFEFRKKLDDLEEKVKLAYLKLDNMKEVENLIEMAVLSLSEEERMPFVEATFKRRRERQEAISQQLAALEEGQKRVEEEVRAKTTELTRLKEKYAALNKNHVRTTSDIE